MTECHFCHKKLPEANNTYVIVAEQVVTKDQTVDVNVCYQCLKQRKMKLVRFGKVEP